MEDKKNNFSVVLITIIILIILFGALLFILNKKGYISFNFVKNEGSSISDINKQNTIEDDTTDTNDEVTQNNTNNIESNNVPTDNNTNSKMNDDEIFALWEKIKGNWGHVSYDKEHDMCMGSSIEINTNVKRSKFNSDGIVTWNIVSFEKISDSKYKVNLILPVNLNNQMMGDTKAIYSDMIVDISKLDSKQLIVGDVEFDYVSENKFINNEATHYQYIDGGLKQEDYCNWYKNNH